MDHTYEYCIAITNRTQLSKCHYMVRNWGNCSDYLGLFNFSQCWEYYERVNNMNEEKHLNAPMPWIGMYIAAASAICSLAMATDAFKGFRTKRLWFPCNYFSLNAFSLALLAIAMKIPVDLTTNMKATAEKLTTISSLSLMSVAMVNFATSVATMDNNEILLNLTALGILVVTIAANVFINSAETSLVFWLNAVVPEKLVLVIFLLLLFVVLCSSAIAVPITKRYLESMYSARHNEIFSIEQFSSEGKNLASICIDDLTVLVKKYGVMAETGSPQFVMARSVVSVTLGLMSMLVALTLAESHVRYGIIEAWYYNTIHNTYPDIKISNYGWSITWILYIQSCGVVLGTVAPMMRWFVAVRFKRLKHTNRRSIKDTLKIEAYWTQMLVEWRESSLPLQIRHYTCRKILHVIKQLLLTALIRIQTLMILASEIQHLFFAVCSTSALCCFRHIKKGLKLQGDSITPTNDDAGGLETESNFDISHFVLLLEDEPQLPKKMLTNICNEFDDLIKMGRRQRSKNIVEFLGKSRNFNGIKQFDNRAEVRSLHPLEPPNCWSLPIVTLTSVAMTITSTTSWHKAEQLVSSVSQALAFVNLIERTLDANGELVDIRNAGDMVWVGVELYRKWQDKELQGINLYARTCKEMLEELSIGAEKTVVEFLKATTSIDDFLVRNPLKWPAKVLAANSMYRITRTLLVAREQENLQTWDEEEMFDCLLVIISDILSACFTNLPQVIIRKCHSNDIKERERNVREAAILLGESEDILQLVQKLELPMALDPTKVAYIEEWRAAMEKDRADPVASVRASLDRCSTMQSDDVPEHVSIEVHED